MKKVLFIGLVWPEPTSSAAGWRMLQLIKLFGSQFEVHFASAAAKTQFSYDLVSLQVKEHPIVLNDNSFDLFIADLNPSIVVFDRFMVEEQYGWRIANSCPEALRVLDTEDLHFLRAARKEAFRKGSQNVDLKNETSLREIAAIYRSDVSLIISQEEMKILEMDFGVNNDLLFFLPFQEDPIHVQKPGERLSFEERENFVFIGNFLHEPNWRTVEILKKDIWPFIRRELPSAEIHIYGAYPSEKVWQLHKPKEGFCVKGRAENSRETLEKYRILLAPIPFGAGAKGKFIDAMYSGTPSITTTIGAESMTWNNLWNGYIADDASAFAAWSSGLYTNKDLWQESQENGFHIFNNTCADLEYSKQLMRTCQERIENIKLFRQKNFTGLMLMHHSTQSTKYMSLWIEEKNKKK